MSMWRWFRLGWTWCFGYRLRSGNRCRLYVSAEDGAVLASFRYEPSVNDELDLNHWISEHSPFTIVYEPQKQKVSESLR